MKPEKPICEPENFETIFRKYSKTLRNYIYYKSGDIDIANDMVQEAFIKLWNNCGKVQFSQALYFLKRVSSNAYLNVVKHKKVVLEYEQTKASDINNESPEFLLEEKEFMVKLESTIADLSEKTKRGFFIKSD